jgi:hypothetical protein
MPWPRLRAAATEAERQPQELAISRVSGLTGVNSTLFPAGSDGVDIFFVISSFIMAYTMSRPDQRSVRASWILCRTGEAADTIKPVGLPHDFARKSTFN